MQCEAACMVVVVVAAGKCPAPHVHALPSQLSHSERRQLFGCQLVAPPSVMPGMSGQLTVYVDAW
jgi:hypothetical protein